MTEQEYKLNRGVKFWNIFASVFFVLLCLAMYSVFLKIQSVNIATFSVTLFDILILTFANYRLVRLFIYDNMTLFIREFFMDLKIEGEGESKKYEFINSKNSFKLTMHKLMNCPWCFGVWTSFVTTFVYFTFPTTKIVFIILSISSLASFFILLTNLVGWHAEGKKLEVNGK